MGCVRVDVMMPVSFRHTDTAWFCQAAKSVLESTGVELRLIISAGKGIGAAINECFGATTAEYVARQEADDWTAAERLAKQVAYLDANPEMDLVTCDFYRVEGDRQYPMRFRACCLEDYLGGAGVHGPPTPTIVARRCVYETVRFSEKAEDEPSPDSDWDLRVLGEGFRWGHISEPLYYYRVNPVGVTRTLKNKGHETYLRQVRDFKERMCASRC